MPNDQRTVTIEWETTIIERHSRVVVISALPARAQIALEALGALDIKDITKLEDSDRIWELVVDEEEEPRYVEVLDCELQPLKLNPLEES